MGRKTTRSLADDLWSAPVLTRRVTARIVKEAIAKSEHLRRAGRRDNCDEESEGTNSVEMVLDESGKCVFPQTDCCLSLDQVELGHGSSFLPVRGLRNSRRRKDRSRRDGGAAAKSIPLEHCVVHPLFLGDLPE
jgi:hypothetical protein